LLRLLFSNGNKDSSNQPRETKKARGPYPDTSPRGATPDTARLRALPSDTAAKPHDTAAIPSDTHPIKDDRRTKLND
jgi:hypothetical protein